MKTLTLICLLAVPSPFVCGEVFFGPSSETNRLVIPENAAIIISAVLGASIICDDCDPDPLRARYVADAGEANVLLRPNGLNYALAGPAELVITERGALSYSVLKGTQIRSVVAPPGSTNLVTVEVGKKVRFFPPLAFSSFGAAMTPERLRFSVRNGDSALLGRIGGGEEFSGPITLEFWQNNSVGAVISLYFTEDFRVEPELGVLQGATGVFEVQVEKSADLKKWFPVLTHPVSSDQKAFYRIRMSR